MPASYTKRSIIYISDKSIMTLNLGLFSHAVIFVLFLSLLITIPSLCYQNYQIKNTLKVSAKELKTTRINNATIQKKIENLEKKILEYQGLNASSKPSHKKISNITENINAAYISNNHYTQQSSSINRINLALNESIAQQQASMVCKGVVQRIYELESFFSDLAIEVNKKSKAKAKCDSIETQTNMIKFLKSSFERIAYLESLANYIPIGLPINGGRISSRFGFRKDPIQKIRRFHNGIDIVGKTRSKIFAPGCGTVIASTSDSKSGHYVLIDHGNGLLTKYAHLSAIKVKKGENIQRGDIIGITGSSGKSTGEHLHYSIKIDGHYINPEKLINISAL